VEVKAISITAASSTGSTGIRRLPRLVSQCTAWFLRALGHHGRLCGHRGVLVVLFIPPTGFLPDEDQGFIFNLITLPAGTAQPAP
jgi:multidrug efflux pump subunit AcrB